MSKVRRVKGDAARKHRERVEKDRPRSRRYALGYYWGSKGDPGDAGTAAGNAGEDWERGRKAGFAKFQRLQGCKSPGKEAAE